MTLLFVGDEAGRLMLSSSLGGEREQMPQKCVRPPDTEDEELVVELSVDDEHYRGAALTASCTRDDSANGMRRGDSKWWQKK